MSRLSLNRRLVLEAQVRSSKPEAAEELLMRMTDSGACIDVACCELLFERCIPRDDTSRAEDWLRRLARRGLADVQQGYMGLLRARGRSGDAAQAEHWMHHAINAGITGCSRMYNAVIHAL